MNIVDKNGTWLVNRGEFPLCDPHSKTRFEPGEPVKATHTSWAKGQPTLHVTTDPSGDASEKELARVAEQNAKLEAEREAAAIAAEAARMAAIGSAGAAALETQAIEKEAK